MENKKLWPCVRCTAKQYEEIREQLMKWGFSDNNRFTTNYQWHVFPILQTGYSNTNARTIGNYNILTRGDQYLCYDIPTFMRDAREVAIREGFFKEKEVVTEKETIKETTVETEKKQLVKKWPCVRCTEEEYKEQILDNMICLGYSPEGEYYISDWKESPILQTGYSSSPGDIGNYYRINPDKGQYLCPDIPTFLSDCREVAIREGWLKPEPEITSIPSSTTDWEQRRYEISKEIITQDVIVVDAKEETEIAKETARKAVLFADALIQELKKEK